jgi:hypothetical protein
VVAFAAGVVCFTAGVVAAAFPFVFAAGVAVFAEILPFAASTDLAPPLFFATGAEAETLPADFPTAFTAGFAVGVTAGFAAGFAGAGFPADGLAGGFGAAALAFAAGVLALLAGSFFVGKEWLSLSARRRANRTAARGGERSSAPDKRQRNLGSTSRIRVDDGRDPE